jgi:hypothetical protein
MGTKRRVIEEHDVVRFLVPVGRWPAGTEGTVISTHPEAMLVEVSDDRGAALDFVSAPVDLLEVTWIRGTRAAV